MGTEPVTRLVVQLGRTVVIDEPGRPVCATGTMHQNGIAIRLSRPEAPHPALVPGCLPGVRVEPCGGVERRYDFVAVPRATVRKLAAPCEVQDDAREARAAFCLSGLRHCPGTSAQPCRRSHRNLLSNGRETAGRGSRRASNGSPRPTPIPGGGSARRL